MARDVGHVVAWSVFWVLVLVGVYLIYRELSVINTMR